MTFNRKTSALMAGGAAMAASFLLPGAAHAVETATWSLALTSVQRCPLVGNCTVTASLLQTLGTAVDYDLNHNASAQTTPLSYAGVTSVNYGAAFASVTAGSGPDDFLDLHTTTVGTFVNSGDLQGYSWNFASAQGVVGYTNITGGDLVIPIDSFVGTVDFATTAPLGNGFVSGALAILNSDIVGTSDWVAYNNTPGFYGQFRANCSSVGAIALDNPHLYQGPSGSLNLSPDSCSGASTFTVAAGDTFYLWARLATFRASAGSTDAGDTFHLGFNPNISEETRMLLTESLVQAPGVEVGPPILPGVPEPATWAMLVLGFTALGGVLRARRRAPA